LDNTLKTVLKVIVACAAAYLLVQAVIIGVEANRAGNATGPQPTTTIPTK